MACSRIISEAIGTTSLKTLRPSCTNSLSGAPMPRGGAVEEAEVVADVVGELGLQPGSQDVPAALGLIAALDDHRGGHVAEDEVAVAVPEVQVAGADLRIDHQHRAAEPAAISRRRS